MGHVQPTQNSLCNLQKGKMLYIPAERSLLTTCNCVGIAVDVFIADPKAPFIAWKNNRPVFIFR